MQSEVLPCSVGECGGVCGGGGPWAGQGGWGLSLPLDINLEQMLRCTVLLEGRRGGEHSYRGMARVVLKMI